VEGMAKDQLGQQIRDEKRELLTPKHRYIDVDSLDEIKLDPDERIIRAYRLNGKLRVRIGKIE